MAKRPNVDELEGSECWRTTESPVGGDTGQIVELADDPHPRHDRDVTDQHRLRQQVAEEAETGVPSDDAKNRNDQRQGGSEGEVPSGVPGRQRRDRQLSWRPSSITAHGQLWT